MHDEYHGMWYMLVPDISGNHNTTGIPGRYQVCISALRTTTQSPLRGKQQKFKQSVKGPANMNTWDSCWNAIYSVNNLEHRKAIVSSFSDACFSSVLMQVSPVCSHQAPVYSWGTAVHAAWANSSLSANRDGTASQSKRAWGRNWNSNTSCLCCCCRCLDFTNIRELPQIRVVPEASHPDAAVVVASVLLYQPFVGWCGYSFEVTAVVRGLRRQDTHRDKNAALTVWFVVCGRMERVGSPVRLCACTAGVVRLSLTAGGTRTARLTVVYSCCCFSFALGCIHPKWIFRIVVVDSVRRSKKKWKKSGVFVQR